MNKHWIKSTCNRIALGALLALLAACAADPDQADGTDTESAAADALGAKEAELVASLPLENGNSLEFYDLGITAVVAERGQALARPLYAPSDQPESVTAVWSRLSRGVAAPRELVELEQRLKTYVGAARLETGPTHAVESSIEEQPVFSSFDKSNCGNGCCNRDWLLHDFPLCRSGNRKWFIFDEPSPQKSAARVFEMQGFACAASGAVWDITIDGKLFRFRLATTQFLTLDIVKVQTTEWWNPKPFVDHTVSTVVRTTNPGTATYCGFMDKY